MKRFQLIALIFLIVISLNANGTAQDIAKKDGKIPREGFDLHYRILGNKGSSILILSGGRLR